MIIRDAVFHIILARIVEPCIPTQQVEFARISSVASTSPLASPLTSTTAVATATTSTTSTTTTTTTTTTPTTTTTVITTTTTVYPCSYCAPIYSDTCHGYNFPNPSSYCLTSEEVPITYTLGPVPSYGLPANTCSTYLSCPSGTIARVNPYGSGFIMGNGDGSPTLTYCSETDGIWYSDVDGHVYDVTEIACQHP